MGRWAAANAFEYTHRDDAFTYGTVAYANSDADGDAVDVVTVATPATVRDGWRRWAWQIIERRAPLKPVLLVMAGPEVEIQPHNFLPKGSMAPPEEGFEVQLLRLPASRFVPQPGEAPRLGGLVGSSVSPVYAHVLRRQDGAMSDADFAVDPCRLDLARITREPTAVRVTHVEGEWDVELRVLDERRPGAFVVTVEPHPDAARLQTRSAFLVQVAHTANYELSAMQRSSLAERIAPFTGGPLLIAAIAQYYAQEDREAKSLVEVRRAQLPDDAVTLQGLDPSRGRYEPFAPSLSFSTAETIFIEAALAGVEMIPVIGSVFEFGHLTYAAVTGFDIVGRRVTQSDLVLMGAFAVIGVIPGVPGHASLGAYKEAGDTLTKRVRPDAASLVSMNPGPIAEFLRLLNNAAPPVIRDAASKVPDAELGTLIATLGKAVKGAAGVRQLVEVLGASILARLDQIELIGDLPVVLFRREMARQHPQSLEAVALLVEAGEDEVVATILDAYNAAIKAGDPDVLRRAVSDEVWEEYQETLRESVVQRIFDVQAGGFRDPVNDEVLLREFMAAGYDAYRRGKLGRGEAPRQALEWALKQRGASRFHQSMLMELGPNYRALLEPSWREIRYAVSRQAAETFDAIMTGLPLQIGRDVLQRAVRLPYSELREVVRQSGAAISEVLGRLFEVDHILEKRFFPFLDASAHPDDFTSFLVPKNPDVARGLEGHGVTGFFYVHSEKTALLARYLPYGSEEWFTAQQIHNAYQLALVHDLGMPFALFDELTGQIFEELARGQGQKLSRAFVPDARVLAGRVQATLPKLPVAP